VQPALDPEAGLVEAGDGAGGDVLPDPFQEAVQFPGRAGGERRDRPG
jgi:hypothetical protein